MSNTKVLPKAEREFFVQAVAFSHYLYNQIVAKSSFFNKPIRVNSTQILAEILFKSEFGVHPLCKEKYPEKDGKWSNNLTCLELDGSWNGKSLKYEGKFYKCFKDWESFAVHWSDMIVFHSKTPTMEYNGLITTYDLSRYEIGPEI